jgi:hypothetical protein
MNKDYRVTVRVRNNNLLKLIEDGGYGVLETAKKIGIGYPSLNDYLNLALAPFNSKGILRVTAEKICEYFFVLPEDVWSPEQLTPLETNRREVEIGYRDLYRLDNQQDPVLAIESDQLKDSIEEMLSHLTPKEREIIKLRFGLEGEVVTLAELGRRFNITSSRINTIERFALSKMRCSNFSKVHTRLQAFEELKEEWMAM